MDVKYKNAGSVYVRLIEECSELIHILCKIQRFGIENYNPITKETNIKLVKSEIRDVKRVIKEYENWLKGEQG